ncbi:hypothetical protein PPACK8108_LOCUS15985 [Phakopsora pachyrhizi]|uniref:Uncharacterized protein n=1 Tax=Phakopsora pachyrhizi TaxID=170000 RepID=A0AAV0BAM0_PHAPC|nr:hypothetical protein PPACK8108_LOCUS15985 [Phakopsora pachyrhizi]
MEICLFYVERLSLFLIPCFPCSCWVFFFFFYFFLILNFFLIYIPLLVLVALVDGY